MLRLDKFLSDAGLGTRSQVKEYLKKGLVNVDGKTVKAADFKVEPSESVVIVDGTQVSYQKFHYFVLYKPAGYLTAREDREKPVVMDLLPKNFKELSPVGRLDEDTEGVLLITDDGELNHRLLSPKYHVVKTYYAELSTKLPEDAAALFKEPMVFSDFTAKPAEDFQALSENSALLSITEGKYHQVKRMFQKIGCEVTYLRRDAFSILTLEGLSKGEFRVLTEDEIHELRKAAGLLN